MKAKSTALRGVKGGPRAKPQAAKPGGRMPYNERRAQILEVASEFFSENGLTAQTRQLAEKCGISQRLLYRFFPTKEDLVAEVYRQEILGAFKAVWFVELQDRSRSAEDRLVQFYIDYTKTTLTRKWLRFFMYASLAEANMAPDYISSIITQLLEVIMREVAHEKGLELPAERAVVHEMGWTLHGAISHYAIRRHLYQSSNFLSEDRVVALHIKTFLGGFEAMLDEYRTHLG